MEHSLFAAARILGPTMGIAAFNYGGISGLSLACTAGFFAILGIWGVFSFTTIQMLNKATADGKKGKKEQ